MLESDATMGDRGAAMPSVPDYPTPLCDDDDVKLTGQSPSKILQHDPAPPAEQKSHLCSSLLLLHHEVSSWLLPRKNTSS